MKNITMWMVLIVAMLTACGALGQNVQNTRVKYYRTKVQLMQDLQIGTLYDVTDNTVDLWTNIDRDKPGKEAIVSIPYDQIMVVKTRKKGQIGTGIIGGTLIGGGVGYLLGRAFTQNEYPPPNADPLTVSFMNWINWMNTTSNAFIGAVAGGVTGGVTGGLIAGSSRKIKIGGNYDKFQKEKEKLRALSLKGQGAF